MKASQRAGKDFDNQIANELHERTDERIQVRASRGSGNTKHAAADVLIRRPHHDVELELKRSSVATDENYYIPKEDIRQLAQCRNEYTHAYLAVKFTYRELLLVWVPQHAEMDTVVEKVVDNISDVFEPRVTDKSVGLSKPDSDEWPSEKSGRGNIETITDKLNIEVDQ